MLAERKSRMPNEYPEWSGKQIRLTLRAKWFWKNGVSQRKECVNNMKISCLSLHYFGQEGVVWGVTRHIETNENWSGGQRGSDWMKMVKRHKRQIIREVSARDVTCSVTMVSTTVWGTWMLLWEYILRVIITREKFCLPIVSLWEVMDVNYTYCSTYFMIYVSQIISVHLKLTLFCMLIYFN